MQGKYNFIFSLDGEQKSFFVSNLDVASFCRLIRSAFQVDKTITALQDAQGNICDLHYFCNNLHAHKDKFYIILSEQRKSERQSRKSHKSKNSRVLATNEEPSYYVDFGAFLQEIQQIRFSPQHPVLTIVLVFDNEYQAGIFGQPIVMRIYKTFAFLQAYYTIIQEEESDSLLLTVFENQILKHEMEMKINHSIAEDVCYQIEQLLCEEEEPEPILQGSFATPNSNANNNIPLIVTRGNEKQILQVEANDNFHSSQGKRTHGVMRVKKAVDKFRNRFESREYEYLLGLIIGQDQSVFAAYQLFQKQQDDENFIRNLKSLLPQEDNNNLSFQNNLKFITSPSRSDLHQSVNFPYDCNPTPGLRSSVTIMDQLLNSGDLDSIESGMLRELRMDSDLDDLVKSLMDYPQDVLLQIIRQYLQSQFQQEITKNFNSHQVEYFLQENANKQNPIYEGFQRFGQNGQLQDLFLFLKDNVGQLEQQLREESSYSYYLMHKRRKDSHDEHFHFHLNLPQMNQQEERKLSVDSILLESKKEINFIDKYHVKVLQKYSNEDYEKLFMTVYDQCSKFCDEHEKAKLHGFYTAQNQRLLEILDKYGQRYDIDSIKSDINDLLTLQNKKIDEIPSPTHGAVIEPKMHKYQNFKFIINFLYEIDKVITLRQAKAFYYLYSIEDMSVMAAYEVYCETKEQDEFLNTLNLIFKVYASSSRFDFNEIEQFDSLIEQQLTILFAYRRCLNQEQRLALEQNMISCDNTLLKLFRDFLRQRDQRIFIQKLSDFANSQIEKQKDNQSMDPYMKKIDQNNQHKDLIKDICAKFLKSKVKQIDLLMDAIDKDNIMLKSSLEVYDYNLDKQDLVENIQLIYNYILKSNVKSILKANLIELGRSKTDLTYLLRNINQDEPILKGAFELYFQTKDEAELKDTISRILKFSNI
ncbi:unnamed protein product [Paramecium primaurelia]|uniref:Uncharacterized protein n=1 Tax=Paramecium primaurelia TaxID=5886 RepID=A0A8S1PM75_PARPR|nr:unnamed protein product [Paramecium primaurelia]